MMATMIDFITQIGEKLPTVLWVLVILLLPVLGIILYLLMGRSRLDAKVP